jgi:hypothetical protein
MSARCPNTEFVGALVLPTSTHSPGTCSALGPSRCSDLPSSAVVETAEAFGLPPVAATRSTASRTSALAGSSPARSTSACWHRALPAAGPTGEAAISPSQNQELAVDSARIHHGREGLTLAGHVATAQCADDVTENDCDLWREGFAHPARGEAADESRAAVSLASRAGGGAANAPGCNPGSSGRAGSSPALLTNARSCGSPVGGALPRPTDRPAASSRTRPRYHAAGTTSVVRCRRAGARGRDRGPQSHRTRHQRGADPSFFPFACSNKPGAALVPSLSRRAS